MSAEAVVAPAGPMAPAMRALGPDLARGPMLLAIALANSHYFLEGSSYLAGYPLGQGWLDRAVAWATATFVDARAFPMFGLLFGYGVAQIVRRQGDAEPKAVRRLLWRRAGVLVVVGFLHAVLLYVGDILAAYGVLLLVGAWAVRWRDRWLLVVAAVFWLLTALPGDGTLGDATGPPDPTMLPTDLATVFTERPLASLFIASLGPIGFACPFLLGLWAGRRRLLEPPAPEQRARRMLVLGVTGVGGVLVAALGAQPLALVLLGARAMPDGSTLSGLAAMHDATGVLGGIGYAALIALLALRLEGSGHSHGRAVLALQATGQRSMTCYLSQSVMWTLAFTPALLGLSDDLTIAGNAALAVLTWLLTVALADWLRRSGRRGPFEVLVRKATYR